MAVATFDTHAAVKALTEAGVDPAHAEAITDMVRDAVTEGVATKAGIARLEAKIDGVKWGLGLLAVLVVAMAARLFGAF